VVYREPARGAHARVAALVDELAASEERFTPAFWALVAGLQAPLVFEAAGLARDIPSRIARPLAEALRSALALCESEEGRARIGDEAAERRALYEDVASRASALEGTLTAPLDEAEIPLPEHPTQVLAIDQLVADDAVAELSRYARRADADAVVRRDGALVWARFAHQGAPMAITVRARESRDDTRGVIRVGDPRERRLARAGVRVGERLAELSSVELVEGPRRRRAHVRVVVTQPLDERRDRVGHAEVSEAVRRRAPHARVGVAQRLTKGRDRLAYARVFERLDRGPAELHVRRAHRVDQHVPGAKAPQGVGDVPLGHVGRGRECSRERGHDAGIIEAREEASRAALDVRVGALTQRAQEGIDARRSEREEASVGRAHRAARDGERGDERVDLGGGRSFHRP
jgi:hypothetical protein